MVNFVNASGLPTGPRLDIFMNRNLLLSICCLLVASVSARAQETLYPVRGAPDVSVLINADRTAFAVNKPFQHKFSLGAADEDHVAYLPDTRTPIAVLWLRIQNTSQRPLKIDTSTFAGTDEEGAKYVSLSPEEAFNKMLADPSGGSIGTKTLRGLSLGKVGGKRTEEEIKDDIVRYSVASGDIPAGGVKEGFIYFEAPRRKNYRLNVTLGEIWSRPLLFSTDKQK